MHVHGVSITVSGTLYCVVHLEQWRWRYDGSFNDATRGKDAFQFEPDPEAKVASAIAYLSTRLFAATSTIHQAYREVSCNTFNMPSKLSKVQKHVSKKKGSKINSLHENSRDAQRLRRASSRDDRVARTNALKQKMNGKWLERIVFLSSRLPETLHPLELATIHDLVKSFVGRHDDELATLRSERRAGRPASNRQTLLEQALDADQKEYESGFWLPNLQDEETLVKLDTWQGDWSSLANLRYIRLSERSDVKESQFPPRGAS